MSSITATITTEQKTIKDRKFKILSGPQAQHICSQTNIPGSMHSFSYPSYSLLSSVHLAQWCSTFWPWESGKKHEDGLRAGSHVCGWTTGPIQHEIDAPDAATAWLACWPNLAPDIAAKQTRVPDLAAERIHALIWSYMPDLATAKPHMLAQLSSGVTPTTTAVRHAGPCHLACGVPCRSTNLAAEEWW